MNAGPGGEGAGQRPRPVSFVSDFGDRDEFAGVCRLVIERLAPGTTVIDVCHGIEPGDIVRGALVVAAAATVAGPAVHLAVVDPGVGSDRLGIAVAAGESFLVGPDNGLLSEAIARLGGADAAVEVTCGPLRSEPVAPTFHGRDVFAPVAAHLAAGRPLAEAGEPIDPGSLLGLDLPVAHVEPGAVETAVLYCDGFGNLILAARPESLDEAGLQGPITVEVAGRSGAAAAVRGRTFADAPAPGGLVVYADSAGRVGIAARGVNAARALEVGAGYRIRLSAR